MQACEQKHCKRETAAMDKLAKRTITDAYMKRYERAKKAGVLHTFLLKNYKKADKDPRVKSYHKCCDARCKKEVKKELHSAIKSGLASTSDKDIQKALRELKKIERPASMDRVRMHRIAASPIMAASCVPELPQCKNPLFKERCGKMVCRKQPRIKKAAYVANQAFNLCKASHCKHESEALQRLEESIYGRGYKEYFAKMDRAKKSGPEAVHRLRLRNQRLFDASPVLKDYRECCDRRCGKQVRGVYKAEIALALANQGADKNVKKALAHMKKNKRPTMSDLLTKYRTESDPVAAKKYVKLL